MVDNTPKHCTMGYCLETSIPRDEHVWSRGQSVSQFDHVFAKTLFGAKMHLAQPNVVTEKNRNVRCNQSHATIATFVTFQVHFGS